MEGGSSGAVVKPGDPDGSRLYLLTTHKEQPIMPPRSPMLAKESLDLIETWIARARSKTPAARPSPVKPKTDFALASIVRGQAGRAAAHAREASEPGPGGPDAVAERGHGPGLQPVVAAGGGGRAESRCCSITAETLELLGVLPFPEGTPHVLKFSRNGSLLLAGGGHGGKSGASSSGT